MRALASIVSKLGSVRVPHQRLHHGADAAPGGAHAAPHDCYKRTPDDNDALRDLSLALDRVGNVLRDMSDVHGALKYFEEELTIDRALRGARARRT